MATAMQAERASAFGYPDFEPDPDGEIYSLDRCRAGPVTGPPPG